MQVIGASTVYTCPVKLPLPAPVPPSLSAPAAIVSSSTRLSPSVPVPLPVLAVTVQVVPLPVTPVIEAPVTLPPGTNRKSAASTPVMLWSKVTVQSTEVFGLVGLTLARLIDKTVGGGRV